METMNTNNSFMYLDEAGIMHCTKNEDTAKEYGRGGKYVPCALADGTGYPKENDQRLVVYADDKEFYVGGNAGGGTKTDEKDFAQKFPKTYAIYKHLIKED